MFTKYSKPLLEPLSGALFFEKGAPHEQYSEILRCSSKRQVKLKILNTTKRLSLFLFILGTMFKLHNLQMKIKSKEGTK